MFPIVKRKELPKVLSGFNPYEKGEFFQCYADAIGHDVAFNYGALEDCYQKLPDNIKSDILTLSLHNEEVQAKLIDWIKNEYLNIK